MNLKASVKPITTLKAKTADLVEQVAAQGKPIVITQRGEAKAVLVDVETYDRWTNAMALLKLLALGQRDVETGRTVSQTQAFARAARALDRKRS